MMARVNLVAGGVFGGVRDCSSAVSWGATVGMRLIKSADPPAGGEFGGVNDFS